MKRDAIAVMCLIGARDAEHGRELWMIREPATLSVLGLGGVVVLLRRRRRNAA